MSVQDRNVDRFAEFPVARLIAPNLLDPTPADKDLIAFLFRPRYNFRINDLQAFARVVATAAVGVRVCIGKELSAVGAPQFGADTAVTFTIEAFDQLDAGVWTTVAVTAAQAFGNTAVITDGFWGVFTIQQNGAQVITTKPAANVMAFLTEAEAIKNAPEPDALNGLVGLLTIEASGGNFIAGTTNTDAALVNNFNTVDRGGLNATLAILATEQHVRADLSTVPNSRLRVAKLGNLVGAANDYVIATVRSAGVAVLTDAHIQADVRPFPLQGESAPDVASATTGAQVP